MAFSDAGYHENDPRYLEGTDLEEPKEMFKVVISMIRSRFRDRRLSVVDVGCAAGAFLHAAVRRLSVDVAVGVDVSGELLAEGRRVVPAASFVEASILEPVTIDSGRTFDVCTCIGTLSVFDDIEPALTNLLALVAPGGSLFVLDLMNADPVDVLVRYRRADAQGDDWQRATNVRSVATYDRVLRRLAPPTATISFTDFRMPFAIERGEDPMRAWTMRTELEPHQLVVGSGQLLDMKIVEVSLA